MCRQLAMAAFECADFPQAIRPPSEFKSLRRPSCALSHPSAPCCSALQAAGTPHQSPHPLSSLPLPPTMRPARLAVMAIALALGLATLTGEPRLGQTQPAAAVCQNARQSDGDFGCMSALPEAINATCDHFRPSCQAVSRPGPPSFKSKASPPPPMPARRRRSSLPGRACTRCLHLQAAAVVGQVQGDMDDPGRLVCRHLRPLRRRRSTPDLSLPVSHSHPGTLATDRQRARVRKGNC
jgi:hypothetical protein